MEGVFKISADNYRKKFFKEFMDLKKRGFMCDATLSTKDGCISVHRLILMVASPYFRKALAPTGSSDKLENIFFDGVSFFHLSSMIDFIYTGEINISNDSLRSVLSLSELLEVEELTEICNKLIDQVNCNKADMLDTDKVNAELLNKDGENPGSSETAPVTFVAMKQEEIDDFGAQCLDKIENFNVEPVGEEEDIGWEPPDIASEDLKPEVDENQSQEMNQHEADNQSEVEETVFINDREGHDEDKYESYDDMMNDLEDTEDIEEDMEADSPTKLDLSGAVRVKSGPLLKQKFVYCRFCNRKFDDLSACRQHQDIAHTKEQDGKLVRQCAVQCLRCSKVFSGVQQLACHEYKVHNVPFDESQFLVYKCEVESCEFQTVVASRFYKHQENMHQSEKVVCAVCGKSYASQDSLKAHMKSHDPNYLKANKCKQCELQFATKLGLVKHVQRVHLKLRNNACEYCPQTFYALPDMRLHQYYKHGVPLPKGKSYDINKCPHCDYSTHQLSRFKIHVEKHQKCQNSLVECQTCHRKFPSEKKLQKHEMEHVREQEEAEGEFGCDICGKRFLKKASLNGHMLRHKQRHLMCPYAGCDTRYFIKHHLDMHIKSVHADDNFEDPFQCLLCNHTTKSKIVLELHMKNNHKLLVANQRHTAMKEVYVPQGIPNNACINKDSVIVHPPLKRKGDYTEEDRKLLQPHLVETVQEFEHLGDHTSSRKRRRVNKLGEVVEAGTNDDLNFDTVVSDGFEFNTSSVDDTSQVVIYVRGVPSGEDTTVHYVTIPETVGESDIASMNLQTVIGNL